jgi:hypothetical protein
MKYDDTEETPGVEKYGARYWNAQIQQALERHEPFFNAGKESIKLYKAKHELTETKRRLNIWWYSINTLIPAYYSSTPKAQGKLRKRTGSLAAEAGAVVLERNAQYALDEHFDFNKVASNATLQYLLTGRAVLWARYEAEFESEVRELAVYQLEDGQFVDGEAQPIELGEGVEIIPSEGMTIARMTIEVKTEEKAILECVQYDDFLTSDARNESEIDWVARRAYLDREQATATFGEEVARKLSYTTFPGDLKRSSKKERHAYEGRAELYEIWCKKTEKVYWLQQSGDKSIISEGEPPIDFEGFFPCVMINSTTDPESVIPVSDYIHCKDQILEVERLTTRIFYTIQAIRANGIFDSTLGDEVSQLLEDDLKMIPVQNATGLRQRGGLAGGVEFLNVAPYIQTLQVLYDARQKAIGQLFETLKVSDLLRGASDPRKTATANRLESSWSSLGLIVRQNEFAQFIGDAISLVAEVIAEQFEPAVIMEVADADNFLIPQLPDPQMLEQVKQEIYSIISDDEQRCYRIQVSSDSLIALDQAQEKAEGLEMLSTVGQFFDQMKTMIESYPPLATFSMALLSNLVRRFKGGEEVEGLFQNALATVSQLAQQREQQAIEAQSQQQDPVMMQLQAQMQAEQMKAEIKKYEIDVDAQGERDKLYIQQQQLVLQQQELELKNNGLQLEMMKIQAQAAGKDKDSEIKKEHNRMQSLLDLQRLELERVATRLSETEKLLEERRLSQQQQLEMVRMQLQSEQALAMSQFQQAREPAPQRETPIVINNVIPKRGKRRANMLTDELGNVAGIEVEDLEEES